MESRLEMIDCVVQVPVFLVLSNQVVMDSGATSCPSDEGSCTSRELLEGFWAKASEGVAVGE